MRIIIIRRSFAIVGGSERVIIDKANYLCERGHQVMLISYEQGNHPLSYKLLPSVAFKDLNCRFFTLSRYSAPLHIYHFFLLKKRLRQSLNNTIDEFSPNVVVLAEDWQFLIKDVLEAADKIPVIAEFHNAYDFIMRNVGKSGNWLKTDVTKYYYQRTLKHLSHCAKLVILTDADAKCWRKHFNNVVVVHNPVTLFPDVIDDVPKDPYRIIFVGRFNHEKRIDRLITAFSLIADKYPNWHVDIYGDGNEKTNLLNQIQETKLEGRIVIHEPTKNIYDEYKRSQMLVLCSDHEASPLVLVEAMACGVPCVSLDCPNGPREIIKDGETGLLAEKGNVNDLAKKIEWMITHETKRLEMSLKAREEAAKYNPSVIMKEWEKLYSSV